MEEVSRALSLGLEHGLDHSVLTSSCGQFTRDVWIRPAATAGSHRLCVVLDAELYLEQVDFLSVFDELARLGDLLPMTLLFVSYLDFEARHRDFVCRPEYARFIAEDAVRWTAERMEMSQEGGHLVCGLSLSGLAAAHIVFLHPEVFSGALCQSGSFWWLADNELSWPRTATRLWPSVGDLETATDVVHPPTGLVQRVSQIDGVANALARFRALGATVEHHVYAGGHDGDSWRRTLAPALRWLVEG